ncbi:CPBP family glutamic-type intramembrane protease [Vacuolonema iberomarrocanum]|uniref:CPBP family glutamic-type intramembrane protease n=1 Tax=Vacuolonema iberomarrocanum TaxID=3454632 RepID=UPI0019FEFE45|nr:CPBP family intramembrane metalloprotease [filamentous cyanobacterium LEGE 07170]
MILLLFFGLAYCLSWVTWLPLVLAEQGWIAGQLSQFLHLLGSLGSALAALIVTALYGGKPGLVDLWRRMVNWRVKEVWHAIAWLSPVGLFFIAALVTGWQGLPWQSFGRSAKYPDLPLLAYWLASIVFYGWGEETGWRGFALPQLQARQSALAATIKLSFFGRCGTCRCFGFPMGCPKWALGKWWVGT